jgi:hypothetical protein
LIVTADSSTLSTAAEDLADVDRVLAGDRQPAPQCRT